MTVSRIVYVLYGPMYKRGAEKMLEGELDSHLGYAKQDKLSKSTTNSPQRLWREENCKD